MRTLMILTALWWCWQVGDAQDLPEDKPLDYGAFAVVATPQERTEAKALIESAKKGELNALRLHAERLSYKVIIEDGKVFLFSPRVVLNTAKVKTEMLELLMGNRNLPVEEVVVRWITTAYHEGPYSHPEVKSQVEKLFAGATGIPHERLNLYGHLLGGVQSVELQVRLRIGFDLSEYDTTGWGRTPYTDLRWFSKPDSRVKVDLGRLKGMPQTPADKVRTSGEPVGLLILTGTLYYSNSYLELSDRALERLREIHQQSVREYQEAYRRFLDFIKNSEFLKDLPLSEWVSLNSLPQNLQHEAIEALKQMSLESFGWERPDETSLSGISVRLEVIPVARLQVLPLGDVPIEVFGQLGEDDFSNYLHISLRK